MEKEILEIIKLQEKRFLRRVEESKLRDGKSFEESIREVYRLNKLKEKS